MKRFLDWLQGICTGLAGFFVCASTVMMLFMVVSRYFAKLGGLFFDNVISIFVAWGVVILIGSVARTDQNIRIDFIANKIFGKKAKGFVYAAETIVGLLVCGYFVYVTWGTVSMYVLKGNSVAVSYSSDLRYPQFVIYAALPLSFLIGVVFYLERGVKQLWPVLHRKKPTVTELKEAVDKVK